MTSDKLKEKIAKLPEWARLHIACLERDRDSARKDAQAFSNTEDPRVFVPGHIGDKPRLALPEDARVRFDIGREFDHIDVNLETERLTCGLGVAGVVVRGTRSIRVHPVSSNVVEISLEDC